MNIARDGNLFNIVGLSAEQLESVLFRLGFDALDVAKALRPPSTVDVSYHPDRPTKPYTICRVRCDYKRALKKLIEEHDERVAAKLIMLARIEGRILAEANRLLRAVAR